MLCPKCQPSCASAKPTSTNTRQSFALRVSDEPAAPTSRERALRAGQPSHQVQPSAGQSWLALRAGVLRRAASLTVAPPSEPLARLAFAVQAAPEVIALVPQTQSHLPAWVASARKAPAPQSAACRRRGLTGRSRGRATARQPGRAPHRPIMRRTAGPPCCCAPLNSALGAAMQIASGPT